MKTLMLPVAGKSSRFPGMRPKWLLTMPNGQLMLEQSVSGLNLSQYDRIVITALRDHIEQYTDEERLITSLKKNIRHDIELLKLNSPTLSHAETIAVTILNKSITGSIFLKDCDNYFTLDHIADNCIATLSLNKIDLVDAKNKSYVNVSHTGFIESIVEKHVTSDDFCVGGYSFKSAQKFLNAFEKLKSQLGTTDNIYISHVIQVMLLDNEIFTNVEVSDYVDWGTLREYRHFCRKYMTLFCDIDGVLLFNGGKFSKSGWDTAPIMKNCQLIHQLQKQKRIYLVITTSRPEAERENLLKKLHDVKIRPDQLLMGLPHAARFMINDYSDTNPFPTAHAINIERDSDRLMSLMENLL